MKFLEAGRVICPSCQSVAVGFIDSDPKSAIHPCRPVPQRGVSRSSRTRGGMRWTQAALLTRALSCGRRSRVVLTSRRWCQVGGRPLMTVANKPGRRGERGISRKTIARGMPGDSGVTVVTTLVCLFYFAREAAGASGARHTLRPLMAEGGKFLANSGVSGREIVESHLGVIARSKATKQSILVFAASGLLR